MSVKAVYIHIPFCKNICSYCDFCKMYYNASFVEEYLEALEKEILQFYQQEPVETIYIGGGTPSSLTPSELKRLFNILKHIDQTALKEYTIEVNPEDITEEKLKLWRENGINRISIGHQTKFPHYQKALGRVGVLTHEKINLVKQYFSNINVDFMYGFDKQTEEEFREDLSYVLSLEVSHISTYSLILEEHTKLFIQKYKHLEEEMDARFYQVLCDELEHHGYEHYEISNFAKPGFSSLHNLTYWNNEQYYGFGLGASGYLTNRYTNTRSLSSYIKGNYRFEEENITKEDAMVYEMILGFRKVKGIEKDAFFQKFGCKIEQTFDIIDLLNQNLLEEENGFYRIPKDKLYLENSILIHFLEVKHEE